ncbi:MAG TPA: hypothetical protein VLS93_12810 [Anaeromyxobacteraceae bacterium]|nr:hypothetical protein [Anaeromyxobacteraceae bacterium]
MVRPSRNPPALVERIPTLFKAGDHVLAIALAEDWRWTVSVDDGPLPARFMTQAEAWEAGVREAGRLDRLSQR